MSQGKRVKVDIDLVGDLKRGMAKLPQLAQFYLVVLLSFIFLYIWFYHISTNLETNILECYLFIALRVGQRNPFRYLRERKQKEGKVRSTRSITYYQFFDRFDLDMERFFLALSACNVLAKYARFLKSMTLILDQALGLPSILCPIMLHSSWLYIFDLALFYIREEVFGPVAPLLQFRTEEEAIALANDTNAGSALAMIF